MAGSVIAWLLASVGMAGVLVALLLPAQRRRARAHALEGAQASARAVVEQLAYYVETVHPGDDPTAARLLADATERWHTAGALIAQAGTPGECKVALGTAREGLRLVGQACERLGVPGPRVAGGRR